MRILGIETTCDETSAAVLEDGELKADFIYSQIELHKEYNGVVPELASRAHLEKMPEVLETALRDSGMTFGPGCVDAVAFARGPGLPGSLMVGRVAAETAAVLCGAPLIGVDHLEGHMLACEYEKGKVSRPLKFPLIALIASGGHTEIWLAKDYGNYRVLGATRDDAAGEAFDKVAKLMGLPYPGGPEIERLAASAPLNSQLEFPRPYMKGTWDFSFSGLKTAVSYYLQDLKAPLSASQKASVAKAFQDSVVATLERKVLAAARHYGINRIAVGGGVSANGAFRKAFSEIRGFDIVFSEKRYCSDNAAMIALCAMRRLQNKDFVNKIDISPDLSAPSWRRAGKRGGDI